MTGPHKPETTDPGVELRVAGIPACAPDVVPPVHAGLTWHGWTLEHDSDLIRAVQKAGGPAATFSVTFDASDGIRLLLEPHPESDMDASGHNIAQTALRASDARALARALVLAADLSDMENGEPSHPWGAR